MSIRTERVGAVIRDALSAQFQRDKPEYLDGMVTIVSVKMSPDVSVAKIYVSFYGGKTEPELQVKRLNTHAPEIRMALARGVQMRRVPELRFYRDDTLDAIEHISELLRSVRTTEPDDDASSGPRD